MSVKDSTKPLTHRSDACYERLKFKINKDTPVHESKDEVPNNQREYVVIARETTNNSDPYGLLINELAITIEAKCKNPDELITSNLLAKVRVAPGDGS